MPSGILLHPTRFAAVIAGFDRPEELHQITVDGRRVFLGYLYQCESNLPDYEGGVIEKLISKHPLRRR